jgi:IS5 family transposase
MNRELRGLCNRLGRVIRDIRRKIDGDDELEQVFAVPLSKVMQIRRQRQQQRGWKSGLFRPAAINRSM